MHQQRVVNIGSALWFCLALGAFSGCADTNEAGNDVDEPEVEGSKAAISVNDFRVGIQLADNVKNRGLVAGLPQWSNFVEFGPSASPFACDDNCYDPDAARIYVQNDQAQKLSNLDFRFCLRAADDGTSMHQLGLPGCTPWASQGGGVGERVTDSNGYDPDIYSISVETQPWPSNVPTEVDFRIRGRGFDRNDNNAQWSNFTRWSHEGGSSDTGFFCDSNCYDPDGFQLELQVNTRDQSSFCTQQLPCGVGFGDCDSDFECMPGSRCVSGAGPRFGYGADVDVCLDAN